MSGAREMTYLWAVMRGPNPPNRLWLCLVKQTLKNCLVHFRGVKVAPGACFVRDELASSMVRSTAIPYPSTTVPSQLHGILLSRRSYVNTEHNLLRLTGPDLTGVVSAFAPPKYHQALCILSYKYEVFKLVLKNLSEKSEVDTLDALNHLFRYIKYLHDVREAYVGSAHHRRKEGAKDVNDWRCPSFEYHLWLEVKYGQYGMRERDNLLKDCNVDFNYVYYDRKPDVFQSIDWVEYVQQRTDDPCDTTGGGGTVKMGDSPIVIPDTVNRLVKVIVHEEEEATRRYRTDAGAEGPGSPSKVLLGKGKQDDKDDTDGDPSDSIIEVESQGEADAEMEDQSHADGDGKEGGSTAEEDSKARVDHAKDECDLETSSLKPSIHAARRWGSKFSDLLFSIRMHLRNQHGIDIDEHVDAPSITALLTSLGEEDQLTHRALSVLLRVEEGLDRVEGRDSASNGRSGHPSRADNSIYQEGAGDESDAVGKRKRGESGSELTG
ncbi:hypothetical protein CONPUDRAFT_78408 [Coniophora puteana RWD-64-598 SS2]|uniref:Uncharacterized protein n=1 Tax=Coniophora puteana (strain RWD-64-598) TaxID=741705 RepID=R7SDW7_CONPW|nr:uncharacterized protein CONPUDRAFT_78408 [Coniophora puteana RWD-64-598 SS2]EIW73947.1 hypothetical protein CONPUDRAFT_78408 [Coniophora puteana RWD-64-598 SS2]